MERLKGTPLITLLGALISASAAPTEGTGYMGGGGGGGGVGGRRKTNCLSRPVNHNGYINVSDEEMKLITCENVHCTSH